jgi:hypothetical protein
MPLDPAPRAPVDEHGEPRFGTYAGTLATTDLAAAGGRLTRLRRARRWQWFFAADDEYAVGGAVVSLGPVGQVFVWVADRLAGRLVVDRARLRPGPLVSLADATVGPVAWTRGLGERLTVERAGDDCTVAGSLCGVDLSLSFAVPTQCALTAVCPVDGDGVVNVTQKEASHDVTGHVAWGDQRHDLENGVGLLDATRGLLAHQTGWRWAMGVGRDAAGRRVAFNCVAGFNDGRENAVWVDGEPRAVGPATVTVDHDRVAVETAHGVVDAELAVEAERADDTTLGPFGSWYRQPLGRWRGTVAGEPLATAVGVAEDHRARW